MSRLTRITFVCHGATAATKSAAFPADESLLDGETASAERIKSALSHAHSVLSAPELRTHQTAAALAANFAIEADLRDIDYGRWAGKQLGEVHADEMENLGAWVSDIEAAPHGGESIAAAIMRVRNWLGARIELGGHTLAVTHPAVIRAAIISTLDAPGESFWKIDVQPWSLAEFTSDGRRWALRQFGRLPD